MSNWILQAIRTGIKSTRYPQARETAAGVTPGLPETTTFEGNGQAEEVAASCPTRVLTASEAQVRVEDPGRCVHCFRCSRRAGVRIGWRDDFEWASFVGQRGDVRNLAPPFSKSLHVFVVDAGDCGACLNEFAQLSGPYYNFQRLGIFVTPTPRHADVMIVVGPVTDHLSDTVSRCYAALPKPKRVIAVGACAMSGGVFGPSFAAGTGAADVVPVDVAVPGCPPPPLAMLHALLLVMGRTEPARPSR
jgi:Ni,Fe-hydrogenase III small subunit